MSQTTWPTKTLGEVCEKPQYGFTASAATESVGPRFLRITDLRDGGLDWSGVPFCACTDVEREKFKLKTGDLVVARIGATTGRTSLILDPPDAVFASYLIRLRPKKELNPFFLFFFTQSNTYRAWIDGNKDNNLKGGVNASLLTEIEAPLPQKWEQEKIAAVLWKAQRAIEVEKRLIATTRELKQSAIRQLFTQGLRGEPQKETDIGRIPQSWDVKRVCDVAVIKGGKRLPKGEALVNKDTGFPYIRVTDMRDNSVDPANLRFVPRNIQSGISRYVISFKDVYISIAGTIGLVGTIPESLDGANLTENAARLILTEPDMDARFLMRALDSPNAQQQFRSLTAKNAQPKLALTRIEQALVPKPADVNEQKEIARILDVIQQKISVHERKFATLQESFKTLLHQLMTGQVRVNNLDIDTSEVEASN